MRTDGSFHAVLWVAEWPTSHVAGDVLWPLLFPVSWAAPLPWLTLPMSLRLMAAMMENQGAALNPYLGATARLLALFGLLLAVGIAW